MNKPLNFYPHTPAGRRVLRDYLRKRDDESHDLREMAFGLWQRKQGALVNASVPLWIEACGMKR